jgi:Domain of unknown function (DUF317)
LRSWSGRRSSGADTPEEHFLISPRHLAGGGEVRHITEFLRAWGWQERTPASGMPITFVSPDRSGQLGYDTTTDPVMWTITGGPTDEPARRWQANFSGATPVEIIAGFADGLSAPTSHIAPNPWRPLEAQAWRSVRGEHPTVARPDGSAMLQFRRHGESAVWWASAKAPGEKAQVWDAIFSEHTPMRLIEGFSAR